MNQEYIEVLSTLAVSGCAFGIGYFIAYKITKTVNNYKKAKEFVKKEGEKKRQKAHIEWMRCDLGKQIGKI